MRTQVFLLLIKCSRCCTWLPCQHFGVFQAREGGEPPVGWLPATPRTSCLPGIQKALSQCESCFSQPISTFPHSQPCWTHSHPALSICLLESRARLPVRSYLCLHTPRGRLLRPRERPFPFFSVTPPTPTLSPSFARFFPELGKQGPFCF